MGYTTEFAGEFEIDGKMSRSFINYINRFSSTRRMKRDNEKIKEIYPNWEKLCFEGNLGENGEFLAIRSCIFGQEKDDSILEYNYPANTQPGLWCQWIIETNEDFEDEDINEFTGVLKWNGGEKFYNYVEWLIYMIDNFFGPKGYELNGVVNFQGEESDDYGEIIVQNNQVTVETYLDEEVDLDEVSDDELIEELQSRGYVVGKAI